MLCKVGSGNRLNARIVNFVFPLERISKKSTAAKADVSFAEL